MAKYFTDELLIKLLVDEPDLYKKIPKMAQALRDMADWLEESQGGLPAFPSGGAFNGDGIHFSFEHYKKDGKVPIWD